MKTTEGIALGDLVDQFTLLPKGYVWLGGCDLTRNINSLHPILLQLEDDQTSVDFTRGRSLSVISKPSVDLREPQSLLVAEDLAW